MISYARTFALVMALHLLVIAAAMAGGIRAGWAGEICTYDREAFIAGLALAYGEIDIGGGLSGEHVAVRIYASRSGSFSVVKFATDGSACLVASGTDLELVAPTLPNPDEKDS